MRKTFHKLLEKTADSLSNRHVEHSVQQCASVYDIVFGDVWLNRIVDIMASTFAERLYLHFVHTDGAHRPMEITFHVIVSLARCQLPTSHTILFLFHLPLETGRPNAVATFVWCSNFLLFLFKCFLSLFFSQFLLAAIDFPIFFH